MYIGHGVRGRCPGAWGACCQQSTYTVPHWVCEGLIGHGRPRLGFLSGTCHSRCCGDMVAGLPPFTGVLMQEYPPPLPSGNALLQAPCSPLTARAWGCFGRPGQRKWSASAAPGRPGKMVGFSWFRPPRQTQLAPFGRPGQTKVVDFGWFQGLRADENGRCWLVWAAAPG